jgi:hypothetical protein
VLETVEYLHKEGFTAAGDWGAWLSDGTWELHRHAYWSQPWAMWHMPRDVTDGLLRASLCVVKGDANYRRLLGDG